MPPCKHSASRLFAAGGRRSRHVCHKRHLLSFFAHLLSHIYLLPPCPRAPIPCTHRPAPSYLVRLPHLHLQSSSLYRHAMRRYLPVRCRVARHRSAATMPAPPALPLAVSCSRAATPRQPQQAAAALPPRPRAAMARCSMPPACAPGRLALAPYLPMSRLLARRMYLYAHAALDSSISSWKCRRCSCYSYAMSARGRVSLLLCSLCSSSSISTSTVLNRPDIATRTGRTPSSSMGRTLSLCINIAVAFHTRHLEICAQETAERAAYVAPLLPACHLASCSCPQHLPSSFHVSTYTCTAKENTLHLPAPFPEENIYST